MEGPSNYTLYNSDVSRLLFRDDDFDFDLPLARRLGSAFVTTWPFTGMALPGAKLLLKPDHNDDSSVRPLWIFVAVKSTRPCVKATVQWEKAIASES